MRTCVVIVNTVSNPNETLAGIASTLIQNATHDRITISIVGMYSWITKNPMSLLSIKSICRHGNEPKIYVNKYKSHKDFFSMFLMPGQRS